jgi:hypothetical protein
VFVNRSVQIVVVLCALLAPGLAAAQSRPLVTEDPETVPTGNILLEAGFDIEQSTAYPVSGLTGNLVRIGTFGLSIGVSPIAEIQIDGGLRNRLAIATADPTAPLAHMLDVTGESTSDVEDLRIGAKVKFVSETEQRPSVAARFWTRLPNAGNESGLGLDTTDFHLGVAMAKTVRSVRVVGNVGVGILPDPVRGDRQNDVLEFGASVARAVRPDVEVVGELNGRLNTRSGTPPPGTDSLAVMRLGARATRGPVRVDGALLLGVTERDPSWGITAGVTWVFHAFEVE